MNNLKFDYVKKAIIVIIGIMLVICVVLALVTMNVEGFNRSDHRQMIGQAKDGDSIEVNVEIGEGWDKIMPIGFEYPEEFGTDSFKRIINGGDNVAYGRTCEFKVTNLSTYIIRDWKLVVPVKEDLFINKSWNGDIEMSQFGGKNTDTFNTMKVAREQVKVESAVVDELVLFPLQKGDEFTYYPSLNFYEYPLPAYDFSAENYASTKIGIIFYTEDENIDLSGAYLVYHFGKKVTDVPGFVVLIVILIILAIVLLVLVIELIIGNRYMMIKKAADEKAQRELGAALKAAEEANKSKTVFLNNMSHDIRTPMNAIIGFTDLLEKNIDDKEKAKDYLKKIKSSNEFLLSLINNVLEMARIESGKTVLHNQYCNANELFQGISDVFAEQMHEKGISFNYSICLLHSNVICDKTKLREIYLNILSNALKYTNSGGRVDFTVSEEQSELDNHVIYKAVFADTGIGMTKEYLETIYEQFSREHTTTEAGVTGTGLGMTIVKTLVDLMQGHISIESEPGIGTTITVMIPFELAEEEIIEKEESETFEIEQMSFQGKRILLAEDNMLNAEIAVEILREAGFEVEHACDGTECIDMLNKAEADYYDIIIMDIQMPKMNGYEAARFIRKMDDAKRAKIPIVAMTANAFVEDIQKSLEAGMDAHITKPIVREEVIKTIAHYM